MSWKNVQYENGKYRTSSSGGGGSSTFADLEDVDLSNLQDGQVPKYNSSTQKWENANESGGSGHNYSTTEQVVGTWIDGKPLYEKTLSFSGSYSGNITLGNLNISNLDIIATINCTSKQSDNTWRTDVFAHPTATNNFGIFIKQNGDIELRTGSNVSAFSLFYITIQYTKTTD